MPLHETPNKRLLGPLALKPELSLWSVTKGTDNAVNQSMLELARGAVKYMQPTENGFGRKTGSSFSSESRA